MASQSAWNGSWKWTSIPLKKSMGITTVRNSWRGSTSSIPERSPVGSVKGRLLRQQEDQPVQPGGCGEIQKRAEHSGA